MVIFILVFLNQLIYREFTKKIIFTSHHERKHIMKKIVLIIGIVLLSTVGVGTFSYFQGWLPFSASDEDVLSTMLENMSKNKTWHSETNIFFLT